VIRRLFLFQPLTEEEATAANAWAAKLGDDRLFMTHVPSPTRLRILLFDKVNKGKKRRGRNVLADAPDRAVAALRAAVISRTVVLNVVTGRTRDADEPAQGNTHDALFTIALPSGSACAFLTRCGYGTSNASMAAQCMWVDCGFLPPTEDARALFWPVRPPRNRRASEMAVIEYAQRLLADVPGF
jgi:hypothetical protein